MRFQILDIVPHAAAPGDRGARRRRTSGSSAWSRPRCSPRSSASTRSPWGSGTRASSSPRRRRCCSGRSPQATDRILLSTGVTVLSLLDPVRVAEDYATIDQLSGGRLEIVIGKGNEDKQFPLFGLDLAKQYEYLKENYELLRLLLREETSSGRARHRADLHGVTTCPRPFSGPFRIWHGSATSTAAVDLAAKYGDPIVSRQRAAAPRELPGAHQPLPRAARGQRARPGRRLRRLRLRRAVPRRHHEQAIEQYRADLRGDRRAGCCEARRRQAAGQGDPRSRPSRRPSNTAPRSSGTPERVAEKILDYHQPTATTCSRSR